MDQKIVLDMCRMCDMVYCSKQDLDTKYNTGRPYNKNQDEVAFLPCSCAPTFISSGVNCEVFYIEYDNNLVVCFRGTESMEDVLTDLKIYKKKFPLLSLNECEWPEVHAGFFEQFFSVCYKLEEVCNNSKKLIFCGHSLGGALATLAAAYFGYKHVRKECSCITFGSPRVGDTLFAQYFDERVNVSLRYVNDNDPVPCLPTSWRYKHVKGLRWLNQDVVMKEIKVWRFYRFLKNTLLSTIGYGYNALDDHSCKNYIIDLEHDST